MLALLGCLNIDVTPPLGLVLRSCDMVCRQSYQEQFREFKAFRHGRSLRFCGDSDYVKMFCTGREIGLVVLALRC